MLLTWWLSAPAVCTCNLLSLVFTLVCSRCAQHEATRCTTMPCTLSSEIWLSWMQGCPKGFPHLRQTRLAQALPPLPPPPPARHSPGHGLAHLPTNATGNNVCVYGGGGTASKPISDATSEWCSRNPRNLYGKVNRDLGIPRVSSKSDITSGVWCNSLPLSLPTLADK